MAERVEIFEMGPRDGLQNEPRLIPTADKIALVDLLSRAGFARIEVTSSAMWSSSNTSRGCRGLGWMSPTGISRRTAMSADTVPSVAADSTLESPGSFLDDVAKSIEAVADTMPDHAQFLARLPASSAAQAGAPAPAVSFSLRP